MNSQQLFYFNLIVGVLFLAYFVFGRSKPKAPTRLNLRAAGSSERQTSAEVQPLATEQGSLKQVAEAKVSLLEPESVPPLESGSVKAGSKQLSIFFIYNGHDWEAHQVLGIPQGASIDIATRAYQEQLKTADPASYEFFEAAHAAVFKKRRNERL